MIDEGAAEDGGEIVAARLDERLGFELAPPADFRFTGNGDRYGWTEGADGRSHLTLYVPSGRLADQDDRRLLTGLREIARIHTGEFRLTPNQNVIVANVAEADKAAIESLARDHGLLTDQLPSALRLSSLSCVAFPTCGLAMAEYARHSVTVRENTVWINLLTGGTFTVEDPEDVPEGEDFTANLNPDSLETITAYVEPSVQDAAPGTRYQWRSTLLGVIERLGVRPVVGVLEGHDEAGAGVDRVEF